MKSFSFYVFFWPTFWLSIKVNTGAHHKNRTHWQCSLAKKHGLHGEQKEGIAERQSPEIGNIAERRQNTEAKLRGRAMKQGSEPLAVKLVRGGMNQDAESKYR